jgi:four helix bundle protein
LGGLRLLQVGRTSSVAGSTLTFDELNMINMKFSRFEDITVWQDARIINKEIWSIIVNSELNNDFSLRNQMSRSSGSIMDNIAEGFERDGNKEFTYFLSVSKASSGELRSQLYRCLDRGYITIEEFEEIKTKTITISRKIKSLMTYLKHSSIKGSKFN